MELTAVQMMEYIDSATDDELVTLAAYIQEARRHRSLMKARRLSAGLRVDDRVKFTGGKPKYLTGQLGTVIEKRGNKVLIRLDTPQGKFVDGRVLAPLTLVEKIS